MKTIGMYSFRAHFIPFSLHYSLIILEVGVAPPFHASIASLFVIRIETWCLFLKKRSEQVFILIYDEILALEC